MISVKQEVQATRPWIFSRILSTVSGKAKPAKKPAIPAVRHQSNWMGVAIASLSFWLLPTILTAIPAKGAEQISVVYGPLQFSLSVDALEALVKEGKVTEELSAYVGKIDPKNLAELREILQRRFEATPTVISQFTSAPLGKTFIERMGRVLQTASGQNGATALRSAFVAAAADPEGLNLLNALRKFPDRTVRVDLTQGLQVIGEFEKLLRNTTVIGKALESEAATEASKAKKIDFDRQPDLRQRGSFTWKEQTITVNDTIRNRPLMVDLYLPELSQNTQQSAPVIVISHGVAGDRNTLSLLAQHLASYGFAVVVMEHPGDSLKKFQEFFTGLAGSPEPIEFIHRPSEIKYVLDELERRNQSDPELQGKLNLQQIGAIGQSMGGYTVLSLAGAQLNFDRLRRDCNGNQFLNLSLLVQCEVSRLTPSDYSLQDNRIKAIIAINPLTSTIFGENGLSQVKIPVMFVAGSDDIFTPALEEQIRPFTWLTAAQKYLVFIEKASHFSLLGGSKIDVSALPPIPKELVGPDPTQARPYLNSLSVAFFKTYLGNQPEYQPYLSAAYAKRISQSPFNLSLIESFTPTQLTEALNITATVKPKVEGNR